MIYIVQAAARGPVKIGKAKNVAARISTLATGHYEPLSVLVTMDAEDAVEGKLHRLLKPHRINGEWFKWCPEVERVVDLMRSGRLPEFPPETQRKRLASERAARAAALVMPDVPKNTWAWQAAELRARLAALPLSTRHIGRIAGVDGKTVWNVLNGDDPTVKIYDALLLSLPALEAEAAPRTAA